MPAAATRLSVFIESSLDGYIATRDGVTLWQESPRSAPERWNTSGPGRVYVEGAP